jgi:hypothetical protein
VEGAEAAGVHFVHQAPRLDAKLEHIMPQVTAMGAAVSVVDFDRDGRPDFYATNSGEGSKNHLYRNRGDGTFEDVAEAMGVADLNHPEMGASMGSVFGDFDNDGYEDLLLYRWGRIELFRNVEGKRFEPVPQAALPEWANVNTGLFLDYDRDGRLDIFLGGYYPERVNLWKLADTKMMPESFEYAKNGGRKYLFHNLGGGKFEEVSEKVGLSSRRWALAAVAADLRGTGYPDLFIANDYGVSEMYVNEGGRFREVGRETGVGYAPKSGMNASLGDVFNQGKFAIYVSNISEEGILLQGNNLWVPERAGGHPAQVREHGHRHGHRPRRLELRRPVRRPQQRRAPRPLPGERLRQRLEAGELLVRLLEDRGGPRARDLRREELAAHGRAQPRRLSAQEGLDQRRRRPLPRRGAHGGRDRPARRPLGGPGRLQRPGCPRRGGREPARPAAPLPQRGGAGPRLHRLRPRGRLPEGAVGKACSNRSAIGAQVTVLWNGGQQQLQEVAGGSGFCAQNQRRLHFGLGSGAKVEKVLVKWPSGKTQEIAAPEVNRLHEIKEPA